LPELSLIDTVTQRSYSHHVLLPPDLANKYAAVPSLHAGWNLLVGIAIVREARRWWVRALGAIMPAFMLASIVLTGNHFIIDGFIGYAVVIVGLMLAAIHANARRHVIDPEPQPQIVAPG
jgi:membrane-associated phospholipid phosphatase